MKFPLRETFLAVFACFLWSTAFVGIKVGLPFTTPINFAGQRFILAGIITMLFMGNYRQNFSALKRNIPMVLKIGFLQTFLLYLLFYLGLNRISGSLGAVITGFSPLWAIVLAHFLMKGDRITPAKALSFILGASGIILVALSGSSGVGALDTAGVLMMLGSSFVSAASAVVIAKDTGKIPAVPLNGAQLLAGGVMLTAVSFFAEDVHIEPAGKYWAALLYLAVLSASAYSIWFHLLKSQVKISFLNLWKFIIPVFGALLSWIFLPEESPSWKAAAGILLVGISIVVYYSRKDSESQ